MGSSEVIAALVGLAGVGLGSVTTYLQQRATRAENWRHDRETRWDQDRRTIYIRFLTAADEVYRAVDFQDENQVQLALVGSQRDVALSAADAVYRAHREVLLMCQNSDVRQTADKLKEAAAALYGIARSVTMEDTSERENLTREFNDIDERRRTAMDAFLDAAARELRIRPKRD